jgi:hypothetical protein
MKKPNLASASKLNNSDLSSELSGEEYIDNWLDVEFSSFNYDKRGGRPRTMKFSDILVCLSLKQKYTCETWKGLYNCLIDKGKTEVDFKIPHYSNFLITIKTFIVFLVQLILWQVNINKVEFLKKDFKIALVDSTPLPVCKTIRSSRHKTMREFAEYSKSTTGWYYGFKLHITCDYETKNVIDFMFSNAKLDDRKYLEKIMKQTFQNTNTMFVADKGYQAIWLEELAKETGNYLITGKRKSKYTNTLASWFDIYLLHIRARIETIFSNLKLNHYLTNTRSRSVLGYTFNYILALYGQVFKNRKRGFAI